MSEFPSLRLSSLAVHAGRPRDEPMRAVAPPLYLSTTYERDPDGTYPRGYSYSTISNPNRDAFEAAMMELEGAAAAVAFPSGLAAIAGVLSRLRPGARVLVPHDLFQGTARMLAEQWGPLGIAFDSADMSDLDAVRRSLRAERRMVWLDTPSNPMLAVADIPALADLAHAHGAELVVDNTFATFVLQRPLALGADAVVYAATKYLAGHSDVVGGIATFAEQGALYETARNWQINMGSVPSPFDSWLVHRGLRTLPIRMQAHCANAATISAFLESHPRVERVFYPGLASHPQHAVARAQMTGGFGGMLSFTIRGDRQTAMAAAARVRLFRRAASLGGVESLIEHRASSPIQARGKGTGFTVPDNLLRLSVGIEDADDLTADLDQALQGNWQP